MAVHDFQNYRAQNLGDPVYDKDAVNLRTLRLFAGGVASGASFTTISATSIILGGTNVTSIFAPFVHSHSIAQVVGLQTALNAKAALAGANFTGPILSGGTDISLLFGGGGGGFVDLTPVYAQLTTKANLSGASFTGIINSGGTNLDALFAHKSELAITNALDTLQTSQITTKANLSGASFTGIINSGGTDLGNIFVTSATTIGTSGEAVFQQKRGNRLEFKTLVQGANITLTSNTTGITIASSSVINFADSEMPSDPIDSVNTLFNLANVFVAGSTHVYLNGLRMNPGPTNDYIESGPQQITFNVAPTTGDILIVDYRY